MSEPISRPLTSSEITRLSGKDPYRIHVLASLDDIKAEQKVAAKWREDHTLKDALEFKDIRNDIAKTLVELARVKAGAVIIQTEVDDYTETKTEFKGMKKLIIGVVSVIGTLWAAVMGILAFRKVLGKGP